MWNLSFISEENFTNHVKAAIEKYGEKLESFDLKRFNKNIIDPIKLLIRLYIRLLGRRLSVMRSFVSVINQTITI
mgnify:CR=1 FL=1